MNSIEYAERGDNTPLTWGLVILVGLGSRDVMGTLAEWTVGDDSDVSDF
jgi:hypothetical protein